MTDHRPDTAMVLAAGFGKRLRPITDTVPKPLVPVGGRKMLDRALDMLVAAGISRAVVNIHYLGEQIIDHCATRHDIDCVISDERGEILETGGGTAKALPLLGEHAFALLNADTFWLDFGVPALSRMIETFDPDRMDMMVLLARPQQATGHSGGIDFLLQPDGRVQRAPREADDGYIYAGAMIVHPRALSGARAEPHSLNVHFDRAIAKGRFFGLELGDGHWFTVGTPDGLEAAELKIAGLVSGKSD